MKKKSTGESDQEGHWWVDEHRSARPVQYFSKEYLEQCKRMKPADILRFLDAYRRLYSPTVRKESRSISLRVPENLLEAFKAKASLHDVPYQTQIKRLMMDWVTGQSAGADAPMPESSRRRGTARKS
ncbi:MAG: CopG family antitoxin [Deltaproteobacteria bacterium]|nr:CopG family antitoxin [Deltaproteobacteria bacterium]